MDHEGLALSTIPLGAAAHRPSDAVASVIDGSLVASRVVAAATCRISLRNAGRGGTNTGFGLWGGPYHVVKRACDRADVLAEQGRFALVRGKVSC
jgi:hypothetical protein